MSFIVAPKNGPPGLLLVVTDKGLLGKKFVEGRVQLDLSGKFYQGEELEKEEVKKLFTQAQHLHLTGKQAVALALEEDLISAKKILWVQGLPHAQVVKG